MVSVLPYFIVLSFLLARLILAPMDFVTDLYVLQVLLIDAPLLGLALTLVVSDCLALSLQLMFKTVPCFP
jgi:hypothetical protein